MRKFKFLEYTHDNKNKSSMIVGKFLAALNINLGDNNICYTQILYHTKVKNSKCKQFLSQCLPINFETKKVFGESINHCL